MYSCFNMAHVVFMTLTKHHIEGKPMTTPAQKTPTPVLDMDDELLGFYEYYERQIALYFPSKSALARPVSVAVETLNGTTLLGAE